MQENKSKFFSVLWEAIKKFCITNVAIKIVSLLFAMLLWGYVVTNINPGRIKVVENVRVSSVGDSDLATRQLVVRGDLNELLGTVNVKVLTDVSHYFSVTSDIVTAKVNLGTVMNTGIVTVPIIAETTVGTIDSLSRSTVTLEIDQLLTKSVPITTSYVGELPDGYWTSGATLSKKEVEISGPEQDVSRIVSAVCEIPLDNRTESYNRTFDLKLFDADGNEVDINSVYSSVVPSVSVRMEILQTKTVPIDASSAIVGAETLPDTYEFVGAVCNPSFVQIAAKPALLKTITSMSVSSIDISTQTSNFVASATLNVPLGVTLVNGSRNVDVTVKISEKQYTHNSTGDIELIGKTNGLNYRLSLNAVNYSVQFPIRLLPYIQNEDISFSFTVDVTELTLGTQDLEVIVIPNITLSDKLDFAPVDTIDGGNGKYTFRLLGKDTNGEDILLDIIMLMSEYKTNVTVTR